MEMVRRTLIDKEVVRDGLFITSRTPSDLPAFCKEIILALTGKVREDITAERETRMVKI